MGSVIENGDAREGVEGKPLEATQPNTLQSDAPDVVNPAAAKSVSRGPALFVAAIVATIFGLALWYLVQPQPILIQGEAAATRVDIAARVSGRVGARPVNRGDNVAVGQTLFEIENPELLAKLREAEAALTVAKASLANVEAGTRVEDVAQRKAALDSATADLALAQKTYDRVSHLAKSGNTPLARLDEATNSLQVAQRAKAQTEAAYQEAVAGATSEQREIARAGVVKAQASIATIRSQVDELIVKAPIAGQVYQIGAELGEYVSPGVPLLSLVELSDIWLRFDLREDLVKNLKKGDQFQVRVPAIGDRPIAVEIKLIAAKGEYAGWRSTRATGDFDLRTFEVRAYPATPTPELRPGMSVYGERPVGKP